MKISYSQVEVFCNELHEIANKMRETLDNISQIGIKNSNDGFWSGDAANYYTKMFNRVVQKFDEIFFEMENWIRNLLIVGGFIPAIIGMLFGLKIEQTAGYYKCAKCNHKYVPTYSSVLWAMHINRTRYMKCPKCGKRSWQKKVISKE